MLVALLCYPLDARAQRASGDTSALRRDIEYLAKREMSGRRTATREFDAAAAYVSRRFAALGVGAVAAHGYLHQYTFDDDATDRPLRAANVVGRVPGTDPVLRNQYVVIGAHLDGVGTEGDRGANDVQLGADDNASGVAVLLELARMFARNPGKRSMLLVAFSGEEQGLLGSRHFVDNPPTPLSSLVAMLNLDMVGRMQRRQLIVSGTRTAREFDLFVRKAGEKRDLRVVTVGSGRGSSDHGVFNERAVPVLHFTTGMHEDYHRPSDTHEKINVAGASALVAMVADVARVITDHPVRPTPIRGLVNAVGAERGIKANVYIGIVPPNQNSDTAGVLVRGVRGGSPAKNAGLRLGDRIVRFGGVEVRTVEQYLSALYSRVPGDQVTVEIIRGSKMMSIAVKLGTRAPTW